MRRRSFLKGSLTLLGLGLTGCPHSQAPSTQTTGERRDPNFQRGHLLRDGGFPTEVSQTEECEAVILGGGVAGLSAGWRWSRAGLADYRILELESEVGGNSRALSYPPTAAPIGAHYLPLPNTEARAVRLLLQEMGILSEQGLAGEHLCHSRQERIYYESRWYDGLIPEDGLSGASLEQIGHFKTHIHEWQERRDENGKKVFALPLQYSSQDPEFLKLDDVSFADYIKTQGWDDPYLLWYLEYACRDDFGASSQTVSAWAGLHYFASRDGGGLGNSDDVLVWPEGNNHLVRFLQEQQAGEVRGGCLVTAVRPFEDRVEVDFVRDGKLTTIKAKTAVYCLPSFTRGKALGVAQPDFHYHPWLTANLWMDKQPKDQEPPGHVAWDNVIHHTPSLGYVVATHQHLSTEPNQPTVWTWYRPFPEGEPREHRKTLLEANWAEWSEIVLSELEEVHSDIRQVCRQLDITILGHGMIRPSVGFIWGDSMKAARRAMGRLFFGHGDLSGMSLFEESQFRGVLAAEDALTALGHPFESFL